MSLSFRIITIILIILTVVLAGFGWLSIHDERKTLRGLLDKQGRDISQAIAHFSIEMLLIEDYPVLETVLENIVENSENILSVSVHHDEKLVAQYKKTASDDGKSFRSEIVFNPGEGERGTNLGWVVVTLSEAGNRKIISQRIMELEIFFAIAFVVLMLSLGFVIRRAVLSRLEQLTRTAEEITSDQILRRDAFRSASGQQRLADRERQSAVSVHEHDEIDRLAESLELMNQAVRDKERLLKEHSLNLEREVAARTRELRIEKDKAESSDRAKSMFLANMSHEIRTPMNGVVGFTRLLSRTPLNQDQAEYVHTIELSIESLRVIIDDILDYSKIEAGRLELQSQPFDLLDVVDEAVALWAPHAFGKGVDLYHALHSDIQTALRGDPVRIRQVLNNLISNAIKFTDQGRVAIWVEPDENIPDQLCFTVDDTGIGIDLKSHGQLFDAFTQVDATMSRRHGGSGLGLAISKRLIERMGGHIGVNSSPNKGARFWFNLRLKCQDPVPERSGEAVLAGKRVLLCDGDETWRRSMRHTLKRMGLDVTENEVMSVDSCPATRDHEAFDLVLMSSTGNGDDDQLAHRVNCCLGSVKAPVVVFACNPESVRFTEHEFLSPVRVLSKAIGYFNLEKALAGLFVAPGAHDEAQQAVSRTHHQPESELQGLKMLVVDDNPINLLLSKTLLVEYGAEVLEVESGEEAVALARREAFDLIFMDIQMPGMNGVEATQLIRADEEGRKRTPIIAMTAHALPSEHEFFLSQGLDDCVSKPIDEELLVSTVKHWTGDMTERPPRKEQVQSDNVMIYDRDAAVERAAGRPEVADQLFQMLLGMLSDLRVEMEDALLQDDRDKLREIGHTLRGAAGDCCANALVTATRQLSEALNSGDEGELQTAVHLVIREMDQLSALETG
ncbi:MAG: ATP-binding protein [Sedimenticola sp.]